MKSINPFAQQQDSSQQNNYNLSDFKYILSNQHAKQFHLIDNPNLIFELARYKFNQNKSHKPDIQVSKSPNQQRKFYRHKSQQQTIINDKFFEGLLMTKDKNLNTLNKKSNQLKKSYQSKSKDVLIKETKLKKIDFQKQQFKAFKEQQSNTLNMDFDSNTKQKQNIQARIISLQRPLTSTTIKMRDSINERQSKGSWKKTFQRKRYTELKTKLQQVIKEIHKCEELSYSEVFEYQQVILRDYLGELVTEMKKQCVQKGELIEMIWNMFFVLINKTVTVIVEDKKSTEKSQLQEQLHLHSQYQQMCTFQSTKIKDLGKKYNESKNVIDRLIYDLRYKRKEVKKLYKSLALCNEKLNQYKVEHIDLQNQHIDLLIDAKAIGIQEARELLRRKLEVNREKFTKEKVGLGKEKLREKIEQEIQEEKLNPQQQEQFKKELFQKINTINKKKNNTRTEESEQMHLVDDFIEKFSSKCIQPANQLNDAQQIKMQRKQVKTHTAINTDFDFKFKNQLTYSVTQTTFSDKIEFSLINTTSTQTPGTQKIKKVESVEVQVDGDNMKILYIKNKMRLNRAMDLSFYFDLKKRDQKVKHVLQNRDSELSLKKQYKNNNSISQLSSDNSESEEKESTKKRLSKNSKDLKNISRQKKTSIFNSTLQNYSNFSKTSHKADIPKIQKKRVTQISQISRFNTQQSQMLKRQKRAKKNTLQGLDTFQQNNSIDRPSICLSNLDSVADNISMNEQKEKYIQNYIMNKQQQYSVLRQNAIFDTFKDYLKHSKQKKSSFFNNTKKNVRNSNIQLQNQKVHHSESSQRVETENSRQCISSSNKIKEKTNQNFVRRASKQSVKPFVYQTNFQAQKQSLKLQFFLSRIIEFTVKKSLIKYKLDPSNFRQCKERSEFVSITQKLDPLLLDVEILMKQNFSKKKKQNLGNIKSTNKFIMMTYSRSIDKMYRNNVLLQNLIRPLFESFEVIYGALKPQQIYKKMVTFISEILSAAKENENYKEFIFFLGLDKENMNSAYLTTFDVCLYLKLLQKLNIGGKMGYQIESVFTSKSKVISQLTNILESQNISAEVIHMVKCKITSILNKLEDFVRQSMDTEDQSKINLFKVSRMIAEEIIKIRVASMTKFQQYINGSNKIMNVTSSNLDSVEIIKSQQVQVEVIRKIVDCCRISTAKKLYFSKSAEQLCLKQHYGVKKITKNELGILLVRIGLVEFQQLEQRMKYVQERQHGLGENKKQKHLVNHQINTFFRNIQKLQIVQNQTNNILTQLLGQMQTIYEIGLIKGLQIKSKR